MNKLCTCGATGNCEGCNPEQDFVALATKAANLELSNDTLIAQNAALTEQVRKLTLERDLAVAHDRQPYPTAEAYKLACKTREKLREQVEKLTAERDEANKYATKWSDAEAALAERVKRLRHALGNLTHDPVVVGMSARIRDLAKHDKRPDPWAAALVAVAEDDKLANVPERSAKQGET